SFPARLCGPSFGRGARLAAPIVRSRAMDIRVLMTADVARCHVGDTAHHAAKLMWDHDCGGLPVVDDRGVPLGMVTDRDICMAAYTRGVPLKDIPIQSVMSRHLYSCRVDDPIETAEK